MKNDKENKSRNTGLTDKNKSSNSDISNSLEQDAIGDKGANNYTPQNRTDNEQKKEQNK